MKGLWVNLLKGSKYVLDFVSDDNTGVALYYVIDIKYNYL